MQRSASLLCTLILAGCASPPAPRAPAPVAPSVTADAVQANLLRSYITDQQVVVQGSLTEQAEIVEAARNGHEQAGRGPATLRFALILAAPNHPQRDPQAALRLLREAMARPELLSPVERALGIVEIARVEAELGLVTENARLVAEAQRERERPRNDAPIAALNRRLQAEAEENARLKKELEEAKAKLEAIANIERNIPARPPANEARKP